MYLLIGVLRAAVGNSGEVDTQAQAYKTKYLDVRLTMPGHPHSDSGATSLPNISNARMSGSGESRNCPGAFLALSADPSLRGKTTTPKKTRRTAVVEKDDG